MALNKLVASVLFFVTALFISAVDPRIAAAVPPILIDRDGKVSVSGGNFDVGGSTLVVSDGQVGMGSKNAGENSATFSEFFTVTVPVINGGIKVRAPHSAYLDLQSDTPNDYYEHLRFLSSGGFIAEGGILADNYHDYIRMWKGIENVYTSGFELNPTQFIFSPTSVNPSTYTYATGGLGLSGSLTVQSFMQAASKTKAQLETITPTARHQVYGCLDCDNDVHMVVSTGAAQSQFDSFTGGIAWH